MQALLIAAAALASLPTAPAQPPLGQPLTLGPGDVIATPSAAVRSAVLGLAETPLTEAVSFSLICLASAEGSIFDCLPESSPLPAGATRLDFIRLAGVEEKDAVDHSLLGLARLQARRTVLRARPGGPKAYLVRLPETLNPADRIAMEDPASILAAAQLHFTVKPDANLMSALYPMAALRDGAGARFTVRCRIEPDKSLFCYDGKTTAALRPGDAEDFILATYQLWSSARVDSPVGSEVELSINWQPGD